jgi:hypothetical protein
MMPLRGAVGAEVPKWDGVGCMPEGDGWAMRPDRCCNAHHPTTRLRSLEGRRQTNRANPRAAIRIVEMDLGTRARPMSRYWQHLHYSDTCESLSVLVQQFHKMYRTEKEGEGPVNHCHVMR